METDATIVVNGDATESVVYTGAVQTFEVVVTAGTTDEINDTKSYTLKLVNTEGDVVDSQPAVLDYNLDGKVTASAALTAKDVDTYDVYLVRSGQSIKLDDKIIITAADFSNVEFEFSADSYTAGTAPVFQSAKMGDVDVTDEIAALLKNGAAYFGYSLAGDKWSQIGSSNASYVDFEAGKSYQAKLYLSNASGTNFAASGWGKNAAEFKAVAATDNSASQTAFEAGKAIAGVDQDGKAVEADDKGRFSVVADGKNALYVIPTSVMPEGGENAVEVVPVYTEGGKTVVAEGENLYKAISTDDEGVSPISSIDAVKTPGTYYVRVQAKDANSVYAGEDLFVPLAVKAFAYDDVKIFNADSDNNGDRDDDNDATSGSEVGVLPYDTDNSTFVYDAEAQHIGFAIDGEAYVPSAITYYDAAGKNIGSTAPVAAGTYTAAAAAADGTPIEATFTIEKLDLSEAVVVASDIKFNVSAGDADYDALSTNTDKQANFDVWARALENVSVNGKSLVANKDCDAVSNFGNLTFAVSPAITKVGAYKAILSAPENDPNITGTATVDFNVVTATETLTVTYAGETFTAGTKKLTGENAFDPAKLGVEIDGEELSADEYTLVVKDSKGNVVENGFKAGEVYTVVARLIPDSDFSAGGTVEVKFTVEDGDMADGDVVASVTYKGDVVGTAIAADYTGKDVMSDVKVSVKDGKKALTEGVEYELVLKKGSEVVEEAVESGIYTLEAKGLTYSGTKSIATIVVGDMQVTDLKLDLGDMGVVAWTGKAVEPVVLYTTDSAEKIAAGTAEYSVLPADFYVAKYENAKTGKAVSEVVAEGEYKVTITPSTKAENISFKAETEEFTVSKTVAGFVDVSTSAWYANVVAKANTLEYMTGISGTAMFAPNATITRAEVAEVFAKMAGLDLDKDKTYPTKFSDVEADAWFAQSVAWASQAGIVGGYEGTDVFGSFDNATREQVATMIYRYAAVAGLDTSVEDEAKALSAYSDADQLTFGKTAMAWCVEQGIMGVDTDSLNPLANMSRAEMAATAVRVQPEAIA